VRSEPEGGMEGLGVEERHKKNTVYAYSIILGALGENLF
jgi:hypothetical protein